MLKNILLILGLFSISLSSVASEKYLGTSYVLSVNDTIVSFNRKNIPDKADSVKREMQLRKFPGSFPEGLPFPIDSYSQDNLSEFSPEYLKRILHVDKSADSLISVAKSVFEEIAKHKRFIDIISGDEIVEFPVGIRKRFSPNSKLSIGVVNARFHPLYAEVDMFARLQLNELNADLFFAASGVKISHKGGIYEEARLHLVKDFPLIQQGGQWLLTFLGDFRRNGLPNEESFLVIDCEGTVKELSLAADIRISKTIALPLKKNGEYAYPDQLEPGSGSDPVNNNSYLGATFRVQANTANDFLFEVDLPTFELVALKGWGFEFKKCVLDLSDSRNASGMKFPGVYADNGFLIRGQRELWRGFYAGEVSVMLPREFRLTSSEERVSVGVENFIIDNHGVSGEFYVENVIPLEKGNAGGWRFSVDRIEAALVANTFTGAGFSGSIVLPLSKGVKKRALKYEALISPLNEYILAIGIDKDMVFDAFRARSKLFKGSYIRMEVIDGKFYPEANLTGIMQFGAQTSEELDTIVTGDFKKSGMDKLKVNGLLFQNLHLQTKAPPYLEVDYLALRDTVSSPEFFGFELGIHHINLETGSGKETTLGFNAYINLDETGVKGDVSMRMIASLHSDNLQEWKFERFEVDSVGVEVRRKNFELSGQLHFIEGHEIYGDALGGKLNLYSETLKLEIGSRAIFGQKDHIKFWYADAFGSPRYRTANSFKIYSLSGGLYHHMRKSGYDEQDPSPSGIRYEPDINTELGFKAMAAFEIKKKVTFSGLTGIEISFNNSDQGGGVRRVGLYGAASLMNSLNTERIGDNTLGDLKEVQKMQTRREQYLSGFHELSIDKQGVQYFASEVFPDILSGKELFAAQVAIDYDLSNDIYWGMFDTFLNLGGIRGDGEKNRLGYLEFYSAPDDWYIYVGTPEKRFGVRDIPVGPLKARANLYFMTGTQLPPPAAPPAHVIDILNLQGQDLEFNRNYSSQLANGQGYAFGATFALGVGFDWGLVYANVEAGVGFDLMMKNFGDVSCRGSSEQIGMNGWFASGQAYAYLQGAIGVKVDVFFMNMDIPVLKGGMALLAQAQLPNPWFIKGYAGLEVHVLGHINIKTRVKVVIGEPCELTEKDGLEEVTMISDITPGEGARDVDVFEPVNIALNLPEGEMVRVETFTGKRYYKAHLDTLVVYSDNKKLKGDHTWNDRRDLLTWTSQDILPGNTDHIVWVKLSFMEYVQGVWRPLIKDGVPVSEERKISFHTGRLPTAIPASNIESMFPVISQDFVLPDEFETGYIKLKKGQDYLFEDGLENVVKFLSEEKAEAIVTGITYDKTNNFLRYDIPTLNNSTEYTFMLTAIVDEFKENQSARVYADEGENHTVSTNKITKTSKNEAAFTRLKFNFSTSRYNTFKEKIRALEIRNHSLFTDGDHDVAGFVINTSNAEPWDLSDISPTRYNNGKPFIRASAHMVDDYFEKEIDPLLYRDYPPERNIRFTRDTTIYGFIPQRAVIPSMAYTTLLKTSDDHPFLSSQFPFRWHLARVYKKDFKDLQQQLANKYLNREVIDVDGFTKHHKLINGVFPYVNVEKYKVYFHYILPYRTTGNKVRVDYQNTF